jgi:hypothetical protein
MITERARGSESFPFGRARAGYWLGTGLDEDVEGRLNRACPQGRASSTRLNGVATVVRPEDVSHT